VKLGVVKSRNRGLAMAKGEYIAILDSNDIALPGKLEKQVAFLESNPDHGACGSFYYMTDNKGKKLPSVTLPVNAADLKTYLYFNICFSHSTLMMRTSLARIFEYRSGFDSVEDHEIVYRISRQWKVANIPCFTTCFRDNGNNLSDHQKSSILEVRKRLDSDILKDLGILFTENELDIHSNFVIMNNSFFSGKVKLETLETWLVNFYYHIRDQPGINLAMVRRILAVRWFLICFKNRHFGLMFRNQLFRGFKGAYLRYNLIHMKNRLTGQPEVV
jgi:glycosyltransferase involved in cell wall biosynthesis